MTKEQLLNHYEKNLRYGTLVYDKINIWKRILHGLLLFLPIAILAFPSMEIVNAPDGFGEGWAEFLYYMFYVAGAAVSMILGARLILRHGKQQLKNTKDLKRYLVDGEIDYEGFYTWQQDKLYAQLDQAGLGEQPEIETLHRQLDAWMQKERFALIGFVTVMTAIGLPVWSAYLSVTFENDLDNALERLLMLMGLLVFTGAMCVVVKTLNDFYNSVFSKYNRVSQLKNIVERILLNIRKYRPKK